MSETCKNCELPLDKHWKAGAGMREACVSGKGYWEPVKEEATPFERLEELTDAFITMEGIPGLEWCISIRPSTLGFPIVHGRSESLIEAVKQAIALWETK